MLGDLEEQECLLHGSCEGRHPKKFCAGILAETDSGVEGESEPAQQPSGDIFLPSSFVSHQLNCVCVPARVIGL